MMLLMLRPAHDVEPATDEDVRALKSACRDYLADIARGGVGPDNKNLYQEDLLRFMGERMPAVLARLGEAEAH
jgi:hypothetical protein